MITADFSAARWRKSSYSGNSGDCVEVGFAPAEWRTSSYSGSSGNCVEVGFAPAAWRTSSHSGSSSNCVQVATAEQAVGVRDSKRPDAGTLVFPATGWNRFLRAC
ncbi:MAG: DUF397 domain-containing protein [Pseudonocardiaceae bacterium]|nr:DUF397 domain-containing protein [Pseudonocardiaceae bacterium]